MLQISIKTIDYIS